LSLKKYYEYFASDISKNLCFPVLAVDFYIQIPASFHFTSDGLSVDPIVLQVLFFVNIEE
jgi:hypothetical protein